MPTAPPRAQLSRVPALPAAGSAYGSYFLVRKLAEGGMAEIFLAKQTGAEGFERNVVIKRMLPHLSEISDFVGMFLDEAKLAARLAHPNIVQINDLGLADGCYYICMEYLSGEDFSTLLRTAAKNRQYVPLNIAIRVIIDAAHGLHFAHEFSDEHGVPLNIVHRDVSPSNIYVTYQGSVKVLDFGIAKAESRMTQTSAGVVKGKYMYMAPEQAQGHSVDRRADIFSLGVSLYEALTLTRPFAKDNDLAILNAVLKNEFLPPRQLRPDLPEELEDIVLKAMAADPNARYPTAEAMATDLARYLATTTTGGGGAQIADYLVTLFGEERRVSKTKIPTLASLSPSFKRDRAESQTPRPAVSKEIPTVAARSADAEERSKTEIKPRAFRPVWFAAAFIALAGAAGVGTYFLAHKAPEPVVVPVAVKPAPPPVEVVPPVVAKPVEPTKPPVETPPVSVDPVVTPPTHVAVKPIVLNIEDIQKVVARSRASITKCFETFGSDLPADKGTASVRLTILGNGHVSVANAEAPLAHTKAGDCLEAQVMRLRFPVNTDKGISLTMPFVYQRLNR